MSNLPSTLTEAAAALRSGTVTSVQLTEAAIDRAAKLDDSLGVYLARFDDPTKQWKFDPSDLDDRDRWGDFQRAYVDALSRCSTKTNPWYVVPADRKWYRNWAVANLLLAHLADMGPDYPQVDLDIAGLRQRLESD